uniref:Myosin motor domain-containing protein n=1 Tax=Aplanochytrium stocchinoi TaxID=215587 RepID=A0A7S3PR52_9STRA|mmetsp:Transcript_17048/g.20508  ORF Transcript_17048/g.20508 Transcript_17048/m.20508 type:complete len:838 (+) Transcript_17048:84-2597(+)|eukprot:CAMPEP_0204827844 /NCGR_PEP_ID=MMETSP1346-20131115/5345_1 /ASSEMBLY_ACC=CAM_ASM_000771 /TAXON_ID=215587 /ORGANISM="Aplanochytrium stocchinoi, Strain GSBS06" /LENGTH=837 /DNA_ID=CAMNT_0051956477 /DNA_START=68 /DNA_END=2581 /DNA_ORIENTATION=-
MAYRGKGGAVNDMVLIDHVDENKILDCLENHHKHSEIYTYIGPVLISVNPYQNIKGLYGDSMIKKFVTKKNYENKPHVYAIAETAYRNMVENLQNECVVITGESGSGKTEAAKKVMEYVAAMSSKSKEVQRVKARLLESNPLLESFGNAKTVRNDNSSRFGKYMEILFLAGDPAGGNITVYLLEKSRVVRQQEGERNFHIFYELLSDRALSRNLDLESVGNYNYISDPGSAKVKTVDDDTNFEDTRQAMQDVEINDQHQKAIFEIIAFILNLGNVSFKGDRDKSKVSDRNYLSRAATSLKVDAKKLEKALTHRTVKGIAAPLGVEQAQFARDAMAKAIYSRLFDWIVRAINKSIKTDRFSSSIGVLDIYGFEILGVNGFEQLCINYTNEKLHQLFIELTLKAEQNEYKKEGIKWQNIDYYNNLPIVDLVEKKRGIFTFMDDESIYPNGNDQSLFNKMKTGLRQKEFITPAKGPQTQFQIKHYAGIVTYDVVGMLERNKDTVFPDIVQLANSSGNPIAADLFVDHEHAKRKKGGVNKRSATTCMQYKKDVGQLMDDLSKCNQHYIRCIKPNGHKRPGMFERDLVLEQVRYLGMNETVKVRRAGYAFRMEFDRFTAKYKCVMDGFNQYEPDAYKTTYNILKSAGVKGFEMGKTKVFIKDAKSILSIEDRRKQFWEDARNMLPEEEDGLIYADKVFGINEKFVNSPLYFALGGRGFYWFNHDGTPAQYFPMEEVEFVGYNKREGWMTIQSTYKGKYEDDPDVVVTYLSKNMYGEEVKNFIEVCASMGYELDAREVNSYPMDAEDPGQYKINQKLIGKGAKRMIKKNINFNRDGKGCCTVM